MADIGTLTPEQMLQQQQILRQQKMAEMLLQQGLQQPQGQMVSGRYVAPSITQNLAGLANVYFGQKGIEKGDQAQLDLAKAIRGQESVALADYMNEFQGKPATPDKVTEMAGPYTSKVPMPTATMVGTPAVAGNPMLANMNALQNPNSPAFLRQHAMKKITEGPNWAEVSQLNPKTGDTDTYVYDKNSPDPKSTMRFVATSKPALTRAESLRLGDEGIGTGGGGQAFVGNAPVGNVTMAGGNVPTAGSELPASYKPVTAVGKNDLVKAYGYDPFKEPTPPNLPNKDIRQWRADLYKPLSGTAGDQVTGAKLYYDTLTKYNNYVDGLTTSDLAKPSVRQMLTSLHAQVKLTGKEANKLGVLNGGDERILDEVIPNYKDILVTKENLKKMIQNQKEFGSNIIVNAYGTQQKPVPETMRKYVAVPKIEEAPATDIKATLKQLNIPYDPSYEYKVNSDGSVDRRKKR